MADLIDRILVTSVTFSITWVDGWMDGWVDGGMESSSFDACQKMSAAENIARGGVGGRGGGGWW